MDTEQTDRLLQTSGDEVSRREIERTTLFHLPRLRTSSAIWHAEQTTRATTAFGALSFDETYRIRKAVHRLGFLLAPRPAWTWDLLRLYLDPYLWDRWAVLPLEEITKSSRYLAGHDSGTAQLMQLEILVCEDPRRAWWPAPGAPSVEDARVDILFAEIASSAMLRSWTWSEEEVERVRDMARRLVRARSASPGLELESFVISDPDSEVLSLRSWLPIVHDVDAERSALAAARTRLVKTAESAQVRRSYRVSAASAVDGIDAWSDRKAG